MEKMYKILMSVLIATLFTACGGDPPDNGLCASVTCQHGTCDSETGVCKCSAGYSGDRCEKTFDTSNCLVKQVFGPADSGKLEITGATGNAEYLNGSSVEVPAGSVAKNTLFCLTASLDTNLPVPDGEKLVRGMKAFIIDPDQPLLPNGKENNVPLQAKLQFFFNKNRGRAQLFANNVFTKLETKFTEKGTIGETEQMSPTVHLFDRPPVIEASASTTLGSREVILDYNKTTDEDSNLPHLLELSATVDEAGTTLKLELEEVAGEPFKRKATLTGGQHKITAWVTDPNKNAVSKELSVTIDLCAKVTCKLYETCRELDGVCTGSDPCGPPSPCKNSGVCDSSFGTAECACVKPWGGPTCEQQDLCHQKVCSNHGTCQPSDGSCLCDGNIGGTTCEKCKTGFVNYPTCVDDECDPNPCLNSGTCSLSTSFKAVCACAGNYNPADKCATCLLGWGPPNCTVQNLCYGKPPCADDGNKCNGAEQCNPATGLCGSVNPVTCTQDGDVCDGTEVCVPATGLCVSQNPLVCNDGKKCNGTETCDKVTGCKPGTPLVCGDGNVCNGTETCDDSVGCKSGTPLVCNDNLGCNGVESCNAISGCVPGAPVSCNGHGSCVNPAGTCSCTGGWSGMYCTVPPAPTVSNVVWDCPSGWCDASITYTATFSSTNADTYEVTLESQYGYPAPGTCVSKASPTTCTGAISGDQVKVKVRVCNNGGTQCVTAYSIVYNVT